MHQLKQVVHDHYPNAAIISLRLKGFVGALSLLFRGICVTYYPLCCLLDWEVSWQRFSQHGLCHSYPLSSFLVGLTISSEDIRGPSLPLLIVLTMPKGSH